VSFVKGALVIQWHELEDHAAEHRQSCDVQWTELRIVPNYYRQLGIDPTATDTEIKQAYRKLATLFHPDLQPSGSRATAEMRMKELNAAYCVLRSSQQRAIYDAQLTQ
jgi:preprotein translocase subunit Sec63